MRIAFTYNVQTNNAEGEAEFDRPETVQFVAETLSALGHSVELIDVRGSVGELVRKLEAARPDLVFNTAEGQHGRFREAFYPALYEQMRLAYTGPDAAGCLLTLDKNLSKRIVAERGVLTPRAVMIDRRGMTGWEELRPPVIVKPNFEGSSKGVTQDSVVALASDLDEVVSEHLRRYPEGVLVEEYIDGIDVAVPFLELARPETAGLLEPVRYSYDEVIAGRRRWPIYDYSLKEGFSDAVGVSLAVDLPAKVREVLLAAAERAIRALGLRDFGRCDFRVTASGAVYFLECNALASLEPGAGLYLSASAAGLTEPAAVIDAILRSAAARYGVAATTSPTRGVKAPKRQSLRVGLTYNLKRTDTKKGDDREAEFDSPETVDAIASAIASHGHQVVMLEARLDLPARIEAERPDVVFNIAEGAAGPNRESQVPALLEFYGIEYTGSDAATLSMTLDKALAKQIVAQAGVPSPRYAILRSRKDKLPKELRYPVIAKPSGEGSSKGVFSRSVARSPEELKAIADELLERYGHGVLVEEFLVGREFTVGLLGNDRPRALPPMEVVFSPEAGEFPVYSFEYKQSASSEVRYDTPAKVDSALERALAHVARTAFVALRCRDVGRIDLRLDADGRPNFIECNPLPGLTPGWSDLCMIATSAGMTYEALIGEILAPAIRRFRARARSRRPPLAGV